MNPARRLLIACCTAVAALAAPATASALVQIDSAPLNIFLGDSGSQQARFDGTDSGEFFSPGNNEPSAGFQLAVTSAIPMPTTSPPTPSRRSAKDR